MTTYQVNKFDGTLLTTIPELTVNTTSTPLKLIGRRVTNYGEIMAENLVFLLENFARSTPPSPALIGQLWFDTSAQTLKVYSNTGWNAASGSAGVVSISSSPPANAQVGQLWFDTNTSELKTWNGTAWVSVAPRGVIPALATAPTNPVLGQMYYNTSSGQTLIWNGTTWAAVGGSTGAVVAATAPSNPSVGQLWFNTSNGSLQVYNGVAFVPSATAGLEYVTQGSNTVAVVRNQASGTIVAVFSNATTPFNGTGVLAGFNNIAAGINVRSDAGYAIRSPAVVNNGADLAERYKTDVAVEAGDVVIIGGKYEITLSDKDFDTNVFGVVSTNPGTLLNANAGSDETHPPIALIGRVPVKVFGPVKKGDRLVTTSKYPGRAVAMDILENMVLTAVIGRALEDNEDGLGVIEAIVGKS